MNRREPRALELFLSSHLLVDEDREVSSQPNRVASRSTSLRKGLHGVKAKEEGGLWRSHMQPGDEWKCLRVRKLP
jgi:hypothetical protein